MILTSYPLRQGIQNDKPPILEVLREYFPELRVKVCGHKAVCLCPFHHEKTPSCHIWCEENRFYSFCCGAYGDSFDLIAHGSGRPLREILREYRGNQLDMSAIEQRRRAAKQAQELEQRKRDCFAQLYRILRDVHRLEKEVWNKPSNENMANIADALYLRESLIKLMDRLNSSDTTEIIAAIKDIKEWGCGVGGN